MIQLSYSWVFIQRKLVEKDICTTQVFTAALFTTVKTWKQPKYPLTDELIKIWYMCVYIYTMEYYSAIKKIQSDARKD